jgi:hypothetical protein
MCGSKNCFDSARLDCVDYLLTVGRDDHAVHVACGTRALRDPANHRFASNIDESFSR